MAYFDAFNSGEAEVFSKFSRQHRTDESLARSSMEERLQGYRQTFEEWGRLRPLRFALTRPEELFVLVETDVGEMVFGFEVEPEPPHKLVSISVSY